MKHPISFAPLGTTWNNLHVVTSITKSGPFDTTPDVDDAPTLVKSPQIPLPALSAVGEVTVTAQPVSSNVQAPEQERVPNDASAPGDEASSGSFSPAVMTIPPTRTPAPQEAGGTVSMVRPGSIQGLLACLGAGLMFGLMLAIVWVEALAPATSRRPNPGEDLSATAAVVANATDEPVLEDRVGTKTPAEAVAATAEDLPSLADRASAGESDCLDALESLPPSERSIGETLAIARGRAHIRHQKLAGIAAELRSGLPGTADVPTLRKLNPFIQDRETATESLAVLASLGTPLAADMLYEIWTGTKTRNETTDFARQLVLGKEVRASASEALTILIDLREAETCEQVKDILPRAREGADRRALVLLGKLTVQRGCGPKGAGDCYNCLRGTGAIMAAIRAVRGRPAPEL